jgi:N-acetylneuraminic acid mutarotase
MARGSYVRILGIITVGLMFTGGLRAASFGRSGKLSLDERVAYQLAVEEVFWQHRLWPDANTTAKPPLSTILSAEHVRARVEDSLRASDALARLEEPISGRQLQAEMERQAVASRQPGVLRELWAALGNDPHVIAEVLVRPIVAERLARERFEALEAGENSYSEDWWREARGAASIEIDEPEFEYSLPVIEAQAPLQDSWTPTFALPEADLLTTAVWTGSEMIVWGGTEVGASKFNSGSRYNPATDTWRTTTGIDAPFPRRQHSAVWTGTEMIVWGGCGLLDEHSCQISSGGRYDPAADAWTSTSTAGAPSPRMNHTAIWTGSAMVVWGGCAFTNDVCQPSVPGSTGGRYDPSTDTWTPTSLGGAPAARHIHTAIWTGTQMVVWGGSNGSAALNTGGRYTPASDTWAATSLTGAPNARYDHTAVWTGSRMIVWGGTTGSQLFNTGKRYDPARDRWQNVPRAGAPSPRAGHTAVWSGDEMIVWGGCSIQSCLNFLDTGGRFDPSRGTWTPTSTVNAPDARNSHLAVWTGAEMIVWGGSRDAAFASPRTGGRYDPATDSWMPTNANEATSAREWHTAVWTGTEMVVWGGEDRFFTTVDTGGRYTLATDSWQPTPQAGAPSARRSLTAVWTGTEMIVWGGQNGSEIVKTGARFNPAANTWSATSTVNAPAARGSHSAVWTGTEMIVWGGSGNPLWMTTGGRYDPASNTWVATATTGAPSGRDSHRAVWTGTQMIVWGGTGASGPVGTGARYTPATNAWIATSNVGAPSGRTDHAAVWTGSEMVVWGGWNYLTNAFFQSGGRYNPASDSWTPTSLSGAPEARNRFAFVWTGTRVIVWGGKTSSDVGLHTGGLYDPASDTWTPTGLARGPSARFGPSGVWTGAEMIVWGGITEDSSTYTFTGGRYTP